MIFAGYGVTAPEFNWDDFKDVDVKGKTIVVLVNDPQVPDAADPAKLDREDVQRQGDDLLRPLDLQVRGGRAARRRRRPDRARDRPGRLSVPGRAGQPAREVRPGHARQEHGTRGDRGLGHARRGEGDPEDGRPGLRRAEEAGADARLQAGAARPQGVDRRQEHDAHARLAATSSPSSKAAIRALRDEYVVYTAHWDHLGVGAPVNGDKIYNGALDNASGVAQLLEIARALHARSSRSRSARSCS